MEKNDTLQSNGCLGQIFGLLIVISLIIFSGVYFIDFVQHFFSHETIEQNDNLSEIIK